MRPLLVGVVVATLASPALASAQINWNARTPWNNLRPTIARGDCEAQQKAPFQIFDNVYYGLPPSGATGIFQSAPACR